MHVKALNAIVHRLHNISHKLVYQPFNRSPNGGETTVNTVFVIHCDSAFKKEDDTGHALKGIIILRCEAFPAGPLGPGSRICHVIDFVSKRLRHVTRSTFSSECFAVCDGADYGLLLRQIAHEFTCGPLTAADARALREGDKTSPVEVSVGTDAMSLFQAVTAIHVKVPAETSLLSHLQYLRELLDKHILSRLFWFDTRDMLADGLTKGSIDRFALSTVCSGTMAQSQRSQSWQSKARRTTDERSVNVVTSTSASPELANPGAADVFAGAIRKVAKRRVERNLPDNTSHRFIRRFIRAVAPKVSSEAVSSCL